MHKKGIYYAFLTALISGTAIFVNKIFVSGFKDPVVYTTLKNSLVAAAFFFIIVSKNKIRKITLLKKDEILKLLLVGVIGGGIPFALFFTGLQKTNAVTSSFIHKTLFIWVAVLAVPLLKEKIGRLGILSMVFLAVGVNLNLKIENVALTDGALLIFLATILWAVENVIAKITLKTVEVDLVVFSRMFIGSLILVAIIILTKTPLPATLSQEQLISTGVSSLLLFLYVTTWYKALKYAPATLVANILVGGALVTNLLSAVFSGQKIPNTELASNILIIIAIISFVIVSSRVYSKAPKTQF